MFSLLITALAIASPAIASPVKRATAEDIPSNCKVLSTLFLQCDNDSGLPSLYPPTCSLRSSGYAACCVTLADGTATELCAYDGLYTTTNQCKTLTETLQLECYNDGAISISSPVCTVSSDGSSECCSRNQDGSTSQNCVSSSDSDECTILTDLTTQCKQGSTYVRTAAQCTSISGGRKCCAQFANGTVSTTCQSIA